MDRSQESEPATPAIRNRKPPTPPEGESEAFPHPHRKTFPLLIRSRVAETKPTGAEIHQRTRHQEGSRRGNAPSDGQTFSTVAKEHCITESPATQHLDRRNVDLHTIKLTRRTRKREAGKPDKAPERVAPTHSRLVRDTRRQGFPQSENRSDPDHRNCFLIEILVSSRRSYNSHDTGTDTFSPEEDRAINPTLKLLVRNA